ncbi:MAG: hypothetical protein ACJAZB_001139 [Psychrosphaera sp.]|jgi:hypothetical protein
MVYSLDFVQRLKILDVIWIGRPNIYTRFNTKKADLKIRFFILINQKINLFLFCSGLFF